MKRFKLILEHDDCVESPCEGGLWRVASFNRRHWSYADPEQYRDERGHLQIGIRRKLQCGTAFFLSYSEHGLCNWSLAGEQGYVDHWDVTSIAGIIFLEDPSLIPPGLDKTKTYKAREASARKFLKIYTEWCNGNTWMFRLVNLSSSPWEDRDFDAEEVWDGGLIGDEDLSSAINEVLEERGGGVIAKVVGEYADHAQWLDIPTA